MRPLDVATLVVACTILGCGGSNSGASGSGGAGGSGGIGFRDMCGPTTAESLYEGFIAVPCPLPLPSACSREARVSKLIVEGDVSEICENATRTTWDPDLGIFTVTGKLEDKPESECGLVVQFGSTSALQGPLPDERLIIEGESDVYCGALPNTAQYTRADNVNGLNAKTYQLTGGYLVVDHITDDALGARVSLELEQVTISPLEEQEKIKIGAFVTACARTPDREDDGVCPSGLP